MNDQDERHELLGRLETPPEFKDWASNTLPTPWISNGHQTVAERRGTSDTKRLTLTSPLRGPADTGRLSRGGKKIFSASVIVSESPPTPAPVLSPSPPGGVHGLPLEIQDSQRDGEILGNSGLGKF